jgi:hypothetical protein
VLAGIIFRDSKKTENLYLSGLIVFELPFQV